MCYKYMWDNLVADNFPSKDFFTYFGLNPQSILCEDLRVLSADSGFSATVSRGHCVSSSLSLSSNSFNVFHNFLHDFNVFRLLCCLPLNAFMEDLILSTISVEL
jgi:hypothetical protein